MTLKELQQKFTQLANEQSENPFIGLVFYHNQTQKVINITIVRQNEQNENEKVSLTTSQSKSNFAITVINAHLKYLCGSKLPNNFFNRQKTIIYLPKIRRSKRKEQIEKQRLEKQNNRFKKPKSIFDRFDAVRVR